MIRRALALLALAAGCAPAPDDESVAATSHAIINGTADNGDPAVMMLVSYAQGSNSYDSCTAVLVTPTTLLTAAHCVDAPTHPNYVFGIFPGADGTQLSFNQLLPVSEVHAHPTYDANTSRDDIGVAVLGTPLGVTPVPVRRDPLPDAYVGKPARIVGYGRTDFNVVNSAGARRQASTSIVSFDEATVVIGDMQRHACIGDSGAPAFVVEGGVEQAVGINSHAPFGCTSASTFMRIDHYLDFLAPWLPPPPPDMTAPADMTPSAQSDLATVSDLTAALPDLATPTTSPEATGCDLAPRGTTSPSTAALSICVALFSLLRRRHSSRNRAN